MATHIKNLIKKFMEEKREVDREKEEIRKFVGRLLDRKIKKHVELKGLCNNRLIFYSPSSNFSYEFNLRKGQLLAAVKEKFPWVEGVEVRALKR